MGFNNQTDDQRGFGHQQVSPQPGLEEGALCKIVMPSMPGTTRTTHFPRSVSVLHVFSWWWMNIDHLWQSFLFFKMDFWDIIIDFQIHILLSSIIPFMAKRETTVPSSKQGLIFWAHALLCKSWGWIKSKASLLRKPCHPTHPALRDRWQCMCLSRCLRWRGWVALRVRSEIFLNPPKGTLLGRPFFCGCWGASRVFQWQIETFRWQWGKVRRDWDDWACLGSTQLPPCRVRYHLHFFIPQMGISDRIIVLFPQTLPQI